MTVSDEFHLCFDFSGTIIVMGSLCNGYPLLIIENALFFTNADQIASKAKRK